MPRMLGKVRDAFEAAHWAFPPLCEKFQASHETNMACAPLEFYGCRPATIKLAHYRMSSSIADGGCAFKFSFSSFSFAIRPELTKRHHPTVWPSIQV